MSRAKFEAAISGFPYEADIRRFGNDSAWPGSYRDIGVDLAWHMWLAGRESMRDEAANFCDANTVLIGGSERTFGDFEKECGGIHQGMDYARAIRKIEP